MSSSTALVVRVGSLTCGFAIAHVVETLRPLAIRALADAPPAVLGVAVVRGEAIPVVELAALLGLAGDTRARWVVLRTGSRRVAVVVDQVVEVRALPQVTAPAPLLRDLAGALVERIGAIDGELVAVLDAARLVAEAA